MGSRVDSERCLASATVPLGRSKGVVVGFQLEGIHPWNNKPEAGFACWSACPGASLTDRVMLGCTAAGLDTSGGQALEIQDSRGRSESRNPDWAGQPETCLPLRQAVTQHLILH